MDEEDQDILRQARYLVESVVHDDFSHLLIQENNISEIPDFDEENVQESIQRYRKHMKHLQEMNDGVFKVNKELVEKLQDMHKHFLEPSEVSKEVLSRKRVADRYCEKMEKTVDHLQQEIEDLQKKLADMKKKDKRAKKRARGLDGISLLVEAAKEI